MQHERPQIGALHCGVLRTCRVIYDEALSVLYGNNMFGFMKPDGLKKFAHGYVVFVLTMVVSQSELHIGSHGQFTALESCIVTQFCVRQY